MPSEDRSEAASQVDALIAHRSSAVARFTAGNVRQGLFVALSGISTSVDSISVNGFSIEKLQHPIAIGARQTTIRLQPTHQLVCHSSEVSLSDGWIIDGALWTICALLKIRSGGRFVACEVGEIPWDFVDGIPIDLQLRARVLALSRPDWWPREETVHVSADDAEWVGRVLHDAIAMRNDAKFHFALECLVGSFEESDLRMAASKIWAGIEGVLGISSELRFRISLYVAGVLAPAGGERLSVYRMMAKMYDVRSKVVHGATLARPAIYKNVCDAQEILGRLLTIAVERGQLWSPSQLEELLLAP